MGSDERNAYSRKVRNESVVITHPCHPYAGQRLDVLHFRLKGQSRSVLVELPNGEPRCVPLSWTDRALPELHDVRSGGRLWGVALVDLTEIVQSWKSGRSDGAGEPINSGTSKGATATGDGRVG